MRGCESPDRAFQEVFRRGAERVARCAVGALCRWDSREGSRSHAAHVREDSLRYARRDRPGLAVNDRYALPTCAPTLRASGTGYGFKSSAGGLSRQPPRGSVRVLLLEEDRREEESTSLNAENQGHPWALMVARRIARNRDKPAPIPVPCPITNCRTSAISRRAGSVALKPGAVARAADTQR